MRYARQNKILKLIENNEIETQEKLSSMLRENGFDVTQATISRDIKELQLIKMLSSSGKYMYAAGMGHGSHVTNRFVKIFNETIKSIDYAGNIVIVKTLSGCANAACEAIDSLSLPHVMGSVAGDNTILIVIDTPEHSEDFIDTFNEMLK